jgi:hypothetical protein
MLRHQRINRWHARDVDDRDLRARLHDLLEQRLHHHVGRRTIKRAN